MNISVILCTYNRSSSLAEALNSIVASTFSRSLAWEVLIVDNNSNDTTAEIAKDFCTRHPDRIRYIFEREPGLSHARNAGIKEAKGDVVVFTDDDVIVEPTWLQDLTATMMNGEWAGVGGRVFPKWNRPPAQWLSLEQWYALGPLPNFDFGPIARELTRAPFGANMAYQKRMFEKYGGFRTDLGRGPYGLMSDEDTEFGSRLLAAGEKLRYEPSAIVYHPVSDDRTRKEYFLSWWFHKGKASIRQFGVQQGTKHLIWGVPLYLVRRLTVWSLKWAFAIGHTQRLSNKLRVWSIAGEISECCRHSVVGKKQTIAR